MDKRTCKHSGEDWLEENQEAAPKKESGSSLGKNKESLLTRSTKQKEIKENNND